MAEFALVATAVLSVLLAGPMGQAQVAQATAFPVIQTVNATTIAGRPVQLDSAGKLLPWPMPNDIGYSYSSYFLSQWAIDWGQFNGDKLMYRYCCFDFDRTTFAMTPDQHWANSTGYLRAMMEGFVERLYPYTGDPHTVEFLRDFVDYELEHGQTPTDQGYVWAGVPYPSGDPGAAEYRGWSAHGVDFVEPHVVGEDGYAYLRLYEMTGEQKYLAAAIRCGQALVSNYRPGTADLSPWPYRCLARNGSFDIKDGKGLFGYSANVVEPIMLFDELLRLHQGDMASYRRVRAAAWSWLMRYPMRNNIWVGYFEDVTASMDSMNQVIPLEFARYVLLHPEKDPQWRRHAKQLIEWVKTTPKWPKYEVHGATVTTEQGNGHDFCCNKPNECCDSHSARLAAVEALYYSQTGDIAYKRDAYRTYNWVTYWQGLPAGAHAPFSDQWWFTDEFADGPRRMMDAFWAVPEWAPQDESHLLGSSSVVTKIAYSKGKVAYSTYDPQSTDVLRLDFSPSEILAGGKPLARLHSLPKFGSRQGYVFDAATGVLRIRHTYATEIMIAGSGGTAPPQYITFDSPHLPGGTVLNEYPDRVINWNEDGRHAWRIGTPVGKLATFTLALNPAATDHASVSFAAPTVLDGLDIYNSSNQPASVAMRSADNAELVANIAPGQLQRVRTGWHAPSQRIEFTFVNQQGLHFDNMAYSPSLNLPQQTESNRSQQIGQPIHIDELDRRPLPCPCLTTHCCQS